MSWEKGPLWTKARLFFQYAFDTQRNDPVFGLWCSLGLELVARAALASISPTLLAYPDGKQRNLLHVVHKETEVLSPRSISATLVFELCEKIFSSFSDQDYKIACALLNRRNAELHSGIAAFDEYKPSQWLVGFYHACNSLTTILKRSLADLFGKEEARLAEEMLAENRKEVKSKVMSAIAAHKKVFAVKHHKDKEKAKAEAEKTGLELSTQRYHRVTCPACGCVATVQGRTFGKEHETHEANGDIVVRQAVLPNNFSCSACGLKLVTYAELEIARLGDHYTRKTSYSAEEHYGLIHPDNVYEYLESHAGDFMEYDNE